MSGSEPRHKRLHRSGGEGILLDGTLNGADGYRIDHLTADIPALIRALGRERATIVGQDWGSLSAWCLARDCPEAMEKLVVMHVPR